MNIIISRALKSVICIDFWFAFFVCVLKPVTSRNPLSDTIGSVLIWHMYHPWSDGLRSFIVNCQRSPSLSTTEIRGFRVITLASIVKMVWVRTLIHDIWNFDNYLLCTYLHCIGRDWSPKFATLINGRFSSLSSHFLPITRRSSTKLRFRRSFWGAEMF